MSNEAERRWYIVCAADDPRAEQVRAFAQTHETEAAQWLPPRQVDDAVRAVRDSRGGVLVFPESADFLEALWRNELDPRLLAGQSVDVRFAIPPAEAPEELARNLAAQWDTHTRAQRRARAVAGVVLSTAAAAAAFLVLWLAG